MRSKLVSLGIRNIGCIGPEGVTVRLDDILCLVGPNNSGKTTVLRAYELAANPGLFSPVTDRCSWAGPEDDSEVMLDVHIPEGMGNIDPKWKIHAKDLRIVRSRWTWPATGGKAVRQTWDPAANDWAEEGKAGGADNVFTSRLPKPMRIKSLDDSNSVEDVLLTLAISPFISELKAIEAQPESELNQSKRKLAETVNALIEPHKARINAISSQVKTGFGSVFPGLGVRLHVEMPQPELKLDQLLKQGSGIRVEEPAGETRMAQQGTGARRALFWSMLQVHNELSREIERRGVELKAKNAELAKELKAKAKDEDKIKVLKEAIASLEAGDPLPTDASDPALPGYILLIDEPENALHPMAARAAQAHLYTLAKHPDWQVLLTTHSPYFINPLEDHTTIARMERSGAGKSITPRLYISDEVEFSKPEKAALQALQLMDVGFSEIFFGSYPIIVEGDTEHAAFIAAAVEGKHELAGKVSLIRARGKAVLVPLAKMLRHFKASFGIVHDIDWPLRSDGKSNAMWTINQEIREQVELCRNDGIHVRHRWSVPDFERFLGGEELGKDKPYAAYDRISADSVLKGRVVELIDTLYQGADLDPPDYKAGAPFKDYLYSSLIVWAKANGEAENVRLGLVAKA